MIRKSKTWEPVFEDDSTALINLSGANLPSSPSDEDFSMATKSGDYLPRLQLMTSNSEKCTEGSFPANHYALVEGQNFTDLGAEVDVLVIRWRPKAIEMGDEIITTYKPASEQFQRIQEKSGEQDSGCMFGPEFLVWIPSVKKFATFFMGSKSSRREAPNMKSQMEKAATLKHQIIKTKKYTWASPSITACSTPIDVPAQDQLVEQATKFLNPPESTVETADAAEVEAQERDR